MTQIEIDDTDREILRLLAENARQPYSTIAETINLSASTVSARVRQLEKEGIIRRFTVDLDLTQYENRIQVMVRLQTQLDKTDSLREAVIKTPYVEHVFTTAEGEIVAVATPPRAIIGNWVQESIPLSGVQRYDVQLLSTTTRSAYSTDAESPFTCANCGTTIGEDELATRVDSSLQQFCCEECEIIFKRQHESSQD